MKVQLKVTKEYDVKYLKVMAKVRYCEDGELNGEEDVDGNMPFLTGDHWCVDIELETGRIIDWPEGNTASLQYKVCDEGTYGLYDENDQCVFEYEGYVPSMMCPEGGGFGDYIIMLIDENGYIINWNPDVERFVEDHFSDD